jgi:hypothetical protein
MSIKIFLFSCAIYKKLAQKGEKSLANGSIDALFICEMDPFKVLKDRR